MAARIRRHRMLFSVAALALLVVSAAAVATPAAVRAADTPRRGGVLLAVIGAEPPSLDPHQEATFANIQLVAPFYSTLLQFDPYDFSKIIGDVATDWKISPDGLTYTFKIRQGIRFHDGSTLTAADVKASYDKIVFPPEGVRSTRKTGYSAVERVEALREPGLVGWCWGPIEESLTMPEPRLFRAKGKAEVGRGRSLGPNSSTYVGTPKVVLDYDTVSDYRGTAA